jgi:hypothetical protein
MPRVSDYAWADVAYDLAWTLAVVQGRTDDELRDAYGVDDSTPDFMTFDAAFALGGEHEDTFGVFQVKHFRDHTAVIEPNGWIGNAPEVARKLSSPEGSFLSLYWSPSGHQFVQATDGEITGRFDPTFIGSPAGANDMLPGWVEPEDFPLERLKSASLEAVERVTGLAFDPAWLEEELPTYRVPV